MSRTAVVDFINASEQQAALQEALSGVEGLEGVVEVAQTHGFDLSASELVPVLSLLGFLAQLGTDADLRAAFLSAPDAGAVVGLAAQHGYRFRPEDLDLVSFGSPSGELSDDELERVSGGVRVHGKQVRLSNRSTFSKRTSDAALAAAQTAAPYVPGGSVVSAAITGVGWPRSSGGE